MTTILKITSGSTKEIAHFVDTLYKSVIIASTYMAPSIKVAEAAKIVENCQRDVNISFVNELALIFDRLSIDTKEVLEAAGSKWNFLKFKPGLVDGHCICVDPYYMIHKAESVRYFPKVIGAGRMINDNMGIFIANTVIKLMLQKSISLKGSKALILGFSFKENCPDIRNTRVIDIYFELMKHGLEPNIYDPWVGKLEVKQEYGIELLNEIKYRYDLVILAVNHMLFDILEINNFTTQKNVIYDVKGVLDKSIIDARL